MPYQSLSLRSKARVESLCDSGADLLVLSTAWGDTTPSEPPQLRRGHQKSHLGGFSSLCLFLRLNGYRRMRQKLRVQRVQG